MTKKTRIPCAICNQNFLPIDVTPFEVIRPTLQEIILRKAPNCPSDGFICQTDLNKFRSQYVQHVLELEKGELTRLDEQVIQSLQDGETVAENVNKLFESERTFGNRVADHLASFGGSWIFIFIFAGFLVFWTFANKGNLPWEPFDPYPFIFLNLMLSCLAAIQAPVILMSQNRQNARDRLAAEHDYRTNLKAEVEIRNLTIKVDQLLSHQWQRLLEIQETMMDMVAEKNTKGNHANPVTKASSAPKKGE